MNVELTKEELQRIWEYDKYIPHDKYTQLDRDICLKLRELLNKK